MIIKPKKVALNSSTYTAITFETRPKVSNTHFPISVYTSDNSKWWLSTDDTGYDAVPVLQNQSYNNGKVAVPEDGVIFYAKAEVGTPDLVVHIGRS